MNLLLTSCLGVIDRSHIFSQSVRFFRSLILNISDLYLALYFIPISLNSSCNSNSVSYANCCISSSVNLFSLFSAMRMLICSCKAFRTLSLTGSPLVIFDLNSAESFRREVDGVTEGVCNVTIIVNKPSHLHNQNVNMFKVNLVLLF